MHAAVRYPRAIRLLTFSLCLSTGLSWTAHAAEGDAWEDRFVAGVDAYGEGNYAEAIELLTDALETAPSDIGAGATHLFLGRVERATTAYSSGKRALVHQEQALSFLERAVSKASSSASKAEAELFLMMNLAELGYSYSVAKGRDVGEPLFQRAYALAQRNRETFPDYAAETVFAFSGHYAIFGQWEKAQALANEAWGLVLQTQLPANSDVRKMVESYRLQLAGMRIEYGKFKVPSRSEQ